MLPSGKFGANAAWFRLNVLTDNLLSALKRLALPGDVSEARPQRVRFLVLNMPLHNEVAASITSGFVYTFIADSLSP